MWCAVSVDARLDVNVALNRPAYQPSTFPFGNTVYRAAYANDGNNDPNIYTGTCAHTNHETNPWWAVDLGAALYVDGVKFTNRDDSRTYALSLYTGF